jgi:hypothetical protein
LVEKNKKSTFRIQGKFRKHFCVEKFEKNIFKKLHFFKDLSCPQELFEIPTYVKQFYSLKVDSELNENFQLVTQNAHNLGRPKRFAVTAAVAVYGIVVMATSAVSIGLSIGEFISQLSLKNSTDFSFQRFFLF